MNLIYKSKILLCLILLCGLPLKAQNWNLVWADEFDAPDINQGIWNINTDGNVSSDINWTYTDRPENIKTENGKLVITAHKEVYAWAENRVAQYTSGYIDTKNKFDFTYGKIEARLKLPGGAGIWPTFWMLGYGSWPSCGEVNIMDYIGSNPDWICGSIHTKDYNSANGMQVGHKKYIEGVQEDYHTYSMEWSDTEINLSIDDERVLSYTKQSAENWPFDKPCYLGLNLIIGKAAGAVDNSIFPQQYLVDYVRVYKDETSISQPIDSQMPVSLSENPFGDKLSVSVSGQEGCRKELSLYDTVGRLCLKTTFDNDGQEIETSTLKPGIYILNVSTHSGNWSCKVVKK